MRHTVVRILQKWNMRKYNEQISFWESQVTKVKHRSEEIIILDVK
jgi:hypothetical protein